VTGSFWHPFVHLSLLLTVAVVVGCAAAPEPPYSAEGFVSLDGQTNPVFALAFSPDGKTFATGGAPWPPVKVKYLNQGSEELKLWETETARVRFRFESKGGGRGDGYLTACLLFSPDGRWLATGEKETFFGGPLLTFWHLDSPTHRPSLSGAGGSGYWPDQSLAEKYSKQNRHNHSWQLAMAPNGKNIATTSDGVEILDVDIFTLENGKLQVRDIRKLTTKGIAGPKVFASCVAFAPDGKSLASAGGPDKAVHWWMPNPGKAPTILGALLHDAVVIRVAFTSDGKTLAAGDDAGVLKFWDLDKQAARHSIQAHQGDVGALAICPDRQIAATGGPDKVIKLWDITTGKLLASLPDQKGRIQALAFAPNGKILASSACDPFQEGEVRLWSVAKLLARQPEP
jgi:WD40 repeat protein